MDEYSTSELLDELISRLQNTNGIMFCSKEKFALLENILAEQACYIGAELEH